MCGTDAPAAAGDDGDDAMERDDDDADPDTEGDDRFEAEEGTLDDSAAVLLAVERAGAAVAPGGAAAPAPPAFALASSPRGRRPGRQRQRARFGFGSLSWFRSGFLACGCGGFGLVLLGLFLRGCWRGSVRRLFVPGVVASPPLAGFGAGGGSRRRGGLRLRPALPFPPGEQRGRASRVLLSRPVLFFPLPLLLLLLLLLSARRPSTSANGVSVTRERRASVSISSRKAVPVGGISTGWGSSSARVSWS